MYGNIYKGLRGAQAIFKIKNKVGKCSLSDFKTYYRAIIIKTGWSR